MASDERGRATAARTQAREAALQMLYALESSGEGIERVIRGFWRETPGEPEGKSYADEIVRGTAEKLEEIDAAISRASENWRLERMARVDRNVLRVATYELGYSSGVPRSVIMDEAVNLAKKFGTEESGRFVNGVLSKIADNFGRIDTDR